MGDIPTERLLIRAALRIVCESHAEWVTIPADAQETIIRRIERGCFEVVISDCKSAGINRLFTEKKFVDRYSAICARVISNLDLNGSVGSSYLLKKVIQGSINPHDVALLPSYDLCPEASVALRGEIAARQNQVTATKVSRAYKCRKCGKNETIPKCAQTRAADEGESMSVTCVHCDHHWNVA